MATPAMVPDTAAVTTLPPEPLPGSIDYYVAADDTLESVAGRFGVSLQSIVDANALQPPFALSEGQRLSIPPRREHIVAKGDTVYNISNRYGVEQADLARVNGLSSDFKIRLGQVLTIPEPPGSVMVAAAPPMTATDATMVEAAPQPVESAPAGPPMSLEPAQPTPSSASSQDVTVVELAPPPAAPSAPAEPVVETTPLVVPDVRPPAPQPSAAQPAPAPVAPPEPEPEIAAVSAPEPVVEAPAAPEPVLQDLPPETPATPPPDEVAVAPLAPPEPTPEPPAVETLAPAPEPSVSTSEGGVETLSAAISEPPPLSGDRFLWPVPAGKVVLGYGPTTSGQHNDGVNIAAPAGTDVRAAENGVVAYAGNELRGFGNLLLIRHADGWTTAYAHNDALLVKRGDVVTRGQAIARVGQTGTVGEPQLHFELRRGTRALDPLPYLGEEGAE